MPLQNLRFTMTYPGGVNLEQKIREFEGGIGISPGNGMPIKYNRSSEVYGQLIAFVIFCGLIYLIGTVLNMTIKVTSVLIVYEFLIQFDAYILILAL